MSFYRKGQNRRKRTPGRKRPSWDDTVQDLTVHRATPEEILLRKEAHKSHNHLSVKLEKMRKDKMTGSEKQQLAIMKEILYDQNQMKEALAKSDSMMAVVKDMFGDDPKRFMGFPNVTTAPHSDGDISSLIASVPDIYTETEKLSALLMDPSALNDDFDDFDDFDMSFSGDEFDCPDPVCYESKLNLQHFHDYLQEEKSKTHNDNPKLHGIGKINNKKTMPSNVSSNNANTTTQAETNGEDTAHHSVTQNDKGKNLLGNLPDPRVMAAFLAFITGNNQTANTNNNAQTPPRKSPPLPSERTPPSAINDTKKIKRSKKVLKSPKADPESVNTTSSMNDMRKALQELESELSAYEHQTGRCPQEDTHKRETFSGYTVALVTAVSRLARYLKETELKVRTEVNLRQKLTQDVYQLRTLVDALATDLILTQEEYSDLYSEYKNYRESSNAELGPLNNQLRDLYLAAGKQSRNDTQNLQQKLSHQQQSSCESEDRNNSSKQSEISTPLNHGLDSSTQSELDSSTYQPLPTQLRPKESLAAVMLSPPVRKTRVRTSTSADTGVQPSQLQASLVNIPQLISEGTTRSADPPRLTQAPPVMNTVSVPRPIPLVQSNLSIPLSAGLSFNQAAVHSTANGQGFKEKADGTTSQLVQIAELSKFTDQSEQQLHMLEEMTVKEALLNNPEMQNLMQTQIAELNRQQEDARRRLLDLLDSQRLQQKQLQGQFAKDVEREASIREGNGWQSNMQKPVQQLVSPPISPISQRSEQVHGVTEFLQQAAQGKDMWASTSD